MSEYKNKVVHNMITQHYESRYFKDKRVIVYPVEFVVRAFLGTYPGLKMPKDSYSGKRILDLGYGDGRNMPLLFNLGFKIYGLEISDKINQRVQGRLTRLGINAELKTGTSAHIPYEDAFFQYILACHSCYYVEPGDTFADNIAEISRVLEPRGYFIASFPMPGSYILKDARLLNDGHYKITNDPYGLRNGTVFRVFKNESEIRKSLTPFFNNFGIGFCDDMYWGINQKVWIIVCRRREGNKS